MTLQISILPASTQAGRFTITSLLSQATPPQVRGIYRDLSKVPAEFASNPNFTAVQGDVASADSLDFGDSTAVLYVPPPIYGSTDMGEDARKNAENVKQALEKASSVKRLVLFSSMGAQYDHGIGILGINHISDQVLKNSVPEVVIPKPGYFQENWAHAFETMQMDPPVFYSPIAPAEHKIPMISLVDIGSTCAEKLLETGQSLPANPHFFDLYGPREYSTLDIKAAVEEITGKPIEAVVIPKEGLAEFFAQALPASSVPGAVEMTEAALPGGIMAGDFLNVENAVRGSTELVDALRALYKPE